MTRLNLGLRELMNITPASVNVQYNKCQQIHYLPVCSQILTQNVKMDENKQLFSAFIQLIIQFNIYIYTQIL